ncbi:MAG: hypothetical protein AAF573_03515 [Bacteroidota bacterium]
MRLEEKEYYEYLDVHPKLLYYAGIKNNTLPKDTSLEDFMNFSAQEKYPVRESLYKNIGLIDQYIREKSDELSQAQVDMLEQFKKFKKGTFYIMKMTKKETLFMDDDYVYSILALNDPFIYFFQNWPIPIMVETVLLPYNGKIIYDGMISNYPIRIGRTMASGLKNEFNMKKGTHRIIKTLPIKATQKSKPNHKEMLSVMMKTKSSREHNYYAIEDLLNEHPELFPHYYKEWGRINTRAKKKALKELGIKKRHFAIYDDTVIASGKSLQEVETLVKGMLSRKEDLEAIHYFKV